MNDNIENWNSEAPNEPGAYWFIGNPFIIKQENGSDIKFLYIIMAEQGIMEGSIYYMMGARVVRNPEGLWQKINLPEFPKGWKVNV